ncbi:Multidrug resistance-associated protein 4 [Stylophora pistillata]|uniref:Multidrug resistance-associated protein 4 n=1 Tax=Stylophora pistillata TaxID=50429 RepID=A0A2B4SWC3_STYPI|nr:Multidrug resistance-associated protein 4 [Stylophora pistillata]
MGSHRYEKLYTSEAEEPRESFSSLLFFHQMSDVFKTGSERTLDEKDFLPLSEEHTSLSNTKKLQKKWNDEIAKSQESGRRPKLWKSVLKTISAREVAIIIFAEALNFLDRMIQPLLLAYLVSALSSDDRRHTLITYGVAVAMGVSPLIGAFGFHHRAYCSELFGIKVRSALKGLVYIKTLLLSKDTLVNVSSGRVIDLISNDVQRMVEAAFWFFPLTYVWLDIFLASFILVFFIGWQAVMGLIFLCVLVPYYAELSSMNALMCQRAAAETDQRLSLITEVVSGIRAIKAYAWESGYREKIRTKRRKEIGIIRRNTSVLSCIATLEYTSAPIATLLSIISLMLTGQPLTPSSVFLILSYVNILKRSVCSELAQGFLKTYEAYVSLSRIEDYLLLENLPLTPPYRLTEKKGYVERSPDILESPKNNLVDFTEATYDKNTNSRNDSERQENLRVSSLTHEQTKRKDTFILQDVEFDTVLKSFTAVTGPVGSGKSTLLSAIAGELSNVSGTISFSGTFVYVPQTAWVFSGTVRENILFGQPYDAIRYARTTEVCALDEDIRKFPNEDQTYVGERGVTLSGGQRARISLARAVYLDVDLYLLDDPLSAVDLNVSQHIMKNCIKGLLGNKTRLIAAHQEEHLKEADQVIALYEGRVLGKGKFFELQERGILNGSDRTVHHKVPKEIKLESGNNEKIVKGEDGMAQLVNEEKDFEISEEDRNSGNMSSKLYWNYFRSGISTLSIFATICFFLIAQGILVAPNVWLAFLVKEPPEEQGYQSTLIIYGCLVSASVVFVYVRAAVFFLVSLRCSERLHDKMVVAFLQAPMLFFDSNPEGRILNRFSMDIGCIDEILPPKFLLSIQLLLLLLTTFILPTVANPWLLIVFIPVAVLVCFITKYYLKTSRELKRLEVASRSPVLSHLAETMNGLDTIRTRRRQRAFEDKFYRHQDLHNQRSVMFKQGARWLAVRLSLLSCLLVIVVAIASILMSQDAAFAGLSLAYIIQAVVLTQITVRELADVETFMASVEQVMAYTKLDPEPGYKQEQLPPAQWPNEGNITLQDFSLTYYPGGPQVLKGINVSIKGGTKIGVAGRTGAGKSSIVAGLMRMPDPDGQVIVDGIKLKDLSIQAARRFISVLGQSPVIFGGPLRKNLDFEEQFEDADLWRVLEDVQLRDFVEKLDGRLNYELLEQGSNISVGERQLICLARVLLQRNQIVILDEPTANVDPDTEKTIWQVVRKMLKNSTVIIIAHRLHTIQDCDKILVFHDGNVSEYDSLDEASKYLV